MRITVYSDESGVFDKVHNDYYVFGGVIFFSKEDCDNYSRKYIGAEKNVHLSESLVGGDELKACKISPKSRNKLYRAVSSCERFGAVVAQAEVRNELFANKKSKQRYLDWVYKMAVKTKFAELIKAGSLNPDDVEKIEFLVDEHSTATDGKYELRQSLEREFKIGMWNFEHMTFYEPLFPKLESLNLSYCNSSKKALIRAADIIANHIYYHANMNDGIIPPERNLHIFYHPKVDPNTYL